MGFSWPVFNATFKNHGISSNLVFLTDVGLPNAILEFLFNHLNMNMIYLKVADFNPNAKNLYKKVGFEETGKFEQFFYRHGKYWDYIVMSITKQRYIKKYEDSNS